jgi:hypothetical protein
MDRQFLIAHFETLLPLAVKWATAVDERILCEGLPLSEQEMADAQAIGVHAPEGCACSRSREFTFPAISS